MTHIARASYFKPDAFFGELCCSECFFEFRPSALFEAIANCGFGFYVPNATRLSLEKVRPDNIPFVVLHGAGGQICVIGRLSTFSLASALIRTFRIATSLGAIRIRFRCAGRPGALVRRESGL